MDKPITPAHAAHLGSFRIPPDMLQAAGVRSASDSDVRELLGVNGNYNDDDLGGIYFPYLDPATKQRTGARVRLDTPLAGGAKYLMEQGCRHLFFAPGSAELLKDIEVPVLFVEAEKSCLALAALAQRSRRTYLIVATGGCSGWKRKKEKVALPKGGTKDVTGPSPDLDQIYFRGRAALIAFDSNATKNPEVRKARNQFRKELAKRGAAVALVEVPDKDGTINGPDDMIAMLGDKSALDIIDQAGGQASDLRVLLKNNDGSAKGSLANAITMLRDATEWRGVIGLNEFSLHTVARKSTPWKKPTGSDWTDVDDIRAADWLQHHGLDVSPYTAAQAVQAVAHENRFHPVRDYFENLRWDGTPRLDSWLTVSLGVPLTPYSSAVGSRWLISAVARIYKPGCKVDHTLMLEGAQGIQKSAVLRILAVHDEWFTDHLSDLDNKDSRMELHGVLIVELAELSNLKRSAKEKVKAFLTAQADHFRLPYDRRIQHVPRSNIFAASSNDKEPFVDETGNRRFWPVRCGKIDIPAVERDRDQLWAEAVHRFNQSEPWWLETKELNDLATEEQEQRYEPGVWDQTILTWLENPTQRTEYDPNAKTDLPVEPYTSSHDAVTVTDILAHAIGKNIDRCTQADRNQVARCLRHANWEEGRKRFGKVRLRLFLRPGTTQEAADE